MKVLLVFQSFEDASRADGGGFLARLFTRLLNTVGGLRAWSSHRRQFSMFLANPREASYMSDLVAQQLFPAYPEAEFDLLVRGTGAGASFAGIEGRVRILTAGSAEADWIATIDETMKSGWSEVVLLYPDAIGLGWSSTEKAIAVGLEPGAMRALNGRRRLFTVTGKLKRKLRLRRFLSQTRATELLLAMLFTFVGAFAWAIDAVGHDGRSRR